MVIPHRLSYQSIGESTVWKSSVWKDVLSHRYAPFWKEVSACDIGWTNSSISSICSPSLFFSLFHFACQICYTWRVLTLQGSSRFSPPHIFMPVSNPPISWKYCTSTTAPGPTITTPLKSQTEVREGDSTSKKITFKHLMKSKATAMLVLEIQSMIVFPLALYFQNKCQ